MNVYHDQKQISNQIKVLCAESLASTTMDGKQLKNRTERHRINMKHVENLTPTTVNVTPNHRAKTVKTNCETRNWYVKEE